MTNHEIILRESLQLLQAGILHGSGQFVTVTDENGDEKRIELPEEIHTFAAWKSAGFSVKKGEHAVAAFPVWKYTQRRQDDDADDADGENPQQANGRMYLRKAYFFTRAQVEKITA